MRTRWIALLAVFALVMVACDGDDAELSTDSTILTGPSATDPASEATTTTGAGSSGRVDTPGASGTKAYKTTGKTQWEGPYLPAIDPDPWGRPYTYRFPGERAEFELISLGRDGQPGGTGEDQDIVNW